MTHRTPNAWIVTALWIAAACAQVACSPTIPRDDEEVGEARSAIFTNGGFENGTAGQPPQGWTVSTFLNQNGVDGAVPETLAGLQLAAGGNALTTTIAATNQPDPDLGATASLRVCRYGTQCARVNFHSSSTYGNGKNVNELSQTMQIGMGDVDPTDGQIHVRFVVAPVLQNPGHPLDEQPYYFVQLTNLSQSNTILYRDFNLSAQPGVPWKTVMGGTPNEIDYVDWSLVDITPNGGPLGMGDMVELQVIASGCQPSGHFGEIYVDGSTSGAAIPGLFLSGSGPAQVNPGGNINYTINYKNGSPPVACSATAPCADGETCDAGFCAETGVTIDFTTPPGTTFQGITPPPGATCVTPPVGTAGTIVCTFSGPVPPGASGSMTVTVNITSPGAACTTILNCSTGTPTCTTGAVSCASGTPTCTTGIPVCTTGTAACDGTTAYCTIGETCDADQCLYPQIVAGNYAISSTQETPLLGNKIVTTDGCYLDSQCPSGDWCDESADKCTPTLANGVSLPNDPPHMNPTLNGMCTMGAGALVCQSGVCSTADKECGYSNGEGPCTSANGDVLCQSGVCGSNDLCGLADGDGPCTVADGGTLCQSGACSVTGTCEPAGGCDVDADCPTGKWCDESMHTCDAQLPNGTTIPSDPPHTNPTLNGMCNAGAGTLVCQSGVCDPADNECGYVNGDGPCTPGSGALCQSGVCDTDGKCGYAVGDGPCTAANGGVVCRSGMCSVDGTCEPGGGCDVDGDCSMGKWCDESVHTCMAQLPNGMTIPSDPPHTMPTLNGMCTMGAGALVCQSGVCDPSNNECGYANGDGPCTAGDGDVVCQSGMCSNDGTCEPVGGCNVDADCPMGKWCDESMHMCTPTLANGMPVPTDPPHMNPTLNGTCTTAAGAVVCTSAVCDTKDNECGYADGDGPCTTANGATVCRSTICDPTSLVCVACLMDSQCPATAPHCDTTTNACVQCTSSSQCSGNKPICDTKLQTCVSCNGDNGAKSSDACPSETEPFCFVTGAMQGSCGKCTSDADCTETGETCDTTSGLCVTGGLVASGNGLLCAARTPGTGAGEGGGAVGALGLMLAAAGLTRRKRR